MTTSAGNTPYTEGAAAVAIDPGVTVSDVDDANLESLTVTISAVLQMGDVLTFAPGPLTGSYVPATGVLTLSGSAPLATYETVLRSVGFSSTNDAPVLVKVIRFAVNDGDLSSALATKAVDVASVDDAPVAVDDTTTVAEDAGASAVSVLVNDTDVDGGPRSVGAITQPANGTVVITGAGSGLTYAPSANYCNTPGGGGGPDMFTYTLNGGSTATVSMTVTCVDDPPVAVGDSATVAEDAAASAVPVLVNDTDIDGGPTSVASVTQPANGTVAITGGGTGVTYAPSADYCNTPPGTTPDTFTYTLNGGSTATASMTVTCVDDRPIAVNDSATVAEDSGATAIDVLANDTDVDGGPKFVASLIQPPHGTAVITGGGTGVTYTPNADFCTMGPDVFAYALNGGVMATVSMTVTCVPDAPVVTTSGTLAVVENDPATPVAPAITVTDVDLFGTIASATVQITGNYAGAQDVLDLANPMAHAPIVAMLVGETLTLSGSASPAQYESALADVTYANTSDAPSSLTRTVTFTVTDDAALSGSDTRDILVTPVDDTPVAVDDSAAVSEDAAASAVAVLVNDTDVDGGALSIQSVTQPAGGVVVITGGGSGLTYAPTANACNSPPGTTLDTFTYTLNGGDSATVSMTVTCVPDAPVVTTSGMLVYAENAPPTPIAPAITVTDADAGATISSATVQVTSNYAPVQDELALANAAAHLPIMAMLAGNTLTLSGSASPAQYASALADVTYSNSSDAPSTLMRTVTFTATDDAALTGSATRDIQVISLDDPPVAVADSATVLEDAAPSAVPVLANDTDVDGGPLSIQSVTQPAGGTVVITGGGSGLTYAPTANACNNPPGTTPDTFTYALSPGGSSTTVAMTVTCVNDAPVADDESFTAVGNTGLVGDDPSDGPPSIPGPKKSITADVLNGDTDVDGPGPLVVAAGTFASNDGGTVVLEADGDFTYTPAAGTSCSDTSDFFDYTVSDQNPATPGTDVGRGSITISGCVWYVSNNAAGNAGTSTAPFDTLAQAETASAAGNTIFVFDGDNSPAGYGAGFDLKANQRLLGEATNLQIGPDVLHTGIPANRPTITDNNADVVALASGNTVRGLDVDPQGTGGGIAGGTGDAGGTISDVRIVDQGTAGTEPGLELDGATGTFDISDLTVDNSAASGTTAGSIGVRLNGAAFTANFASAGTISIATKGAKALDATATNLGPGSVFGQVADLPSNVSRQRPAAGFHERT